MEIIGRSSAHLQNAISSGFENVNTGIVESVATSGISGIENAFETFSASTAGIAGDANLLPSVSEAAAYPGPVESLAKSTDSPILQTLQDQGFKPERELASIFRPGWDKGSGWLSQLLYGLKMDQLIADQSIDGKLADEAARKQAKGSVSEFIPDPPSVVPPEIKLLSMPYFNNDRLGDVHGASKSFYPPANPEKMDNLNEDQSIDGKLADGAARKQAKGPVSDVVPDPPVAILPSVILPPQKTYFQTIDQTAEQMQIDPQPETAQLLQEQFSAVQEMTSAVKETFQLYQQLNFNSVLNIK